MRRVILNIMLAAIVGAMSVGCGAFDSLSTGDTSTGTPYEVVIVCPQQQWVGELGDTLNVVLRQPVEELVQYEPVLDVMRIMPNNFKSLTKHHRNIVIVDVDPSHKEPAIKVQYDVTAKPQVYITIQGPDNHSVAQYVSEQRDNLVHVIEMAERDRDIAYAERYYSQPLYQLLLETFGIEMRIPDNFQLRTKSDDMVWISQEFPLASQGFFIYKYPYEGKQSLSAEALIAARNRFASRIPGPKEGSYMITVDKVADESGENYVPYQPEYRTISIEGRPWVEMVGLWDVENYFMGGPYVSYTTVNPATREVITIDCYLHYPKNEKRNMLRELQHLVHMIDFPATASAETSASK